MHKQVIDGTFPDFDLVQQVHTSYSSTMHFKILALAWALSHTAAAQQYVQPEYTVHPLVRINAKFENLVVRENGQILTTTVGPNASVYQVDPLGKLPTTLIHTFPNEVACVGIAERIPGIFYVATTYVNLTFPQTTVPSEYNINELNMLNVNVLQNGTLSKQPLIKDVANLPHAALLNGIAFARPGSEQLLVADSFRGLIWNVNVRNGTVGVSLNDTSTKGFGMGPSNTGINGLKVYGNKMYWTNTGRASFYTTTIDANGMPTSAVTLIAANITAGVDDFVVDAEDTAFIAGPYNAITKVNATTGHAEIVAGTFNSTTSSLGGPSAMKFGKLPFDRNSLYVTTNGGILTSIANSAGVSRIDLGA
jgi:hypothetical protein